MEEELLHRPTFSDLGYAVLVTLPLGGTVTPTERAWLRQIEAGGVIRPEDRTLILHAARGETLTNSRARDLLGVGRAEATEALQRIRDAGIVRQLGRRGGATYLIEPRLAPAAVPRLEREQAREIVLELAQAEPLTNERVRNETGLDRAEALRLLTDLVSDGHLIRTGTRRGTRYLLAFKQEELLPGGGEPTS
jgi:predicted HTH transcriptional regulator